MEIDDKHLSVLKNEVLTLFSGISLNRFVDATLGAGGHTQLIIEHHAELVEVIGLDQDAHALALAETRLHRFTHFKAIRANFSEIDEKVEGQVDGILADIGVSSMQLDQKERGFSFKQDAFLDMRMDQRGALTAYVIVNTWEEKDLVNIFFRFGEEKRARRVAAAIVQARNQNQIETTLQLREIILPHLEKGKRTDPCTKVFQAIRMAVNQELFHLDQFLDKAFAKLTKGGILAIISFHSLEDRMVKEKFRYLASDKEFTSGVGGLFIDKPPQGKVLTKKPIVAKEDEVQQNPRARSAKLRAIRKL